MDHNSEEDGGTPDDALEEASFQRGSPTRKAARLARLDSPNSNSSSDSSVCSRSPSSCSSTNGYEHASASVSAAVFRPWIPPFKKRYLKTSGGDHFSCLTAPYPPDDPRTARYFELVISKTKAPVYCGNAGKLKGKAIYANTDIKGATRIWTESPFLAMQTEKNKAHIQCCQYCFVPLGDHTAEWHDIVDRFHAKRRREIARSSTRHHHYPHHSTTDDPTTTTTTTTMFTTTTTTTTTTTHSPPSTPPAPPPDQILDSSCSERSEASDHDSDLDNDDDDDDDDNDNNNNNDDDDDDDDDDDSDRASDTMLNQVDTTDLEYVLQVLKLNRRNCGFLRTACQCVCGDLYCSKFCQLRAYHEFHSILCTKGDATSPMSGFMRHMQSTNEIFFLAAKAMARVLSRFLVTRDLAKARETIDMFYKKPWYEVVMLEKPLHTFKELDAQEGANNAHGTGQEEHAQDNHEDGIHSHFYAFHPGGDPGIGHTMDGGDNQWEQHGRGTGHSSTGQSLHSSNPKHGTGGGTGHPVVAPAHALRELLVRTHELILDAIEYNLEYLSKEDQLNGFSVDSLWTACEEILSFEFFVALFGLFEMNNISMEIDHPFQVLIDILDPEYVGLERDTDGDETTLEDEVEDEDAKKLAAEAALAAQMRIRQDPILKRVRLVLEQEDKERARTNTTTTTGATNSTLSSGLMSPISSCRDGGFVGVDGTALFPIICTMNHSCDPNCTVLYTKNGDAHVVAVRDIKQGEELCICYINIDQDVATREHHLREYQFKCFCSRCDRERRETRTRSKRTTASPPQSNGLYSVNEETCLN